jgi:drug/metabolite transporter (DMT)-like permease
MSTPLVSAELWALLALSATVLTSLLPVLNKRLLRVARPAQVAWAVNAASLPLLGLGTLLLTQCRLTGASLTCAWQAPQLDGIFALGLLGAAVLNWAATLLSTHALAQADASLVSPLLTFNPAFTLVVAWLALGETPGVRQATGVAVILLGAYVLEVGEVRVGLAAPLRTLLRRPGTVLAVLASALWGITTVLEKLAIEHVRPPSGPVVAFASTLLLVIFLTPGAILPRRADKAPAGAGGQAGSSQRRIYRNTLVAAALLAGIAPLFGFSAIALGLVGYVTALFKLSAVLTVLWGWLFLHEGGVRQRFVGALVMVVGGVLVAA